MSDFTLLYKKYTNVANLTNELNGSVIVLKRRNMAANKQVIMAHPKIQVAEDEVAKAKQELLGILSKLEDFYEHGDPANYIYQLAENRLFRKHILDNVEYREHIHQSVSKLKNNQSLDNDELTDIDRFVSILDNEASVLYRKLRTTRG
ncbi:hypothetical protein KXD93_30215 [Mucilaginibacter sp. BJC16-A38]|uniref:hypothetical protein n=1 Tax=Mucilaginibacter phenanthrenivorans TaxID=1234842 RepID=UPI002157A90B|nr:hypothetical protein [Mucilaginibacter phenanthrenivorans]MCR8561968.1 hypothetical protein [Mucilaginibacter phenanthrenivorans]